MVVYSDSIYIKNNNSTSASFIFDILKYRDTCESSILILSGIAILQYFWYRMPSVRFDTFNTIDTFDTFNTFDTFDTLISSHSMTSMQRCNIVDVVDDVVVYGSYLHSTSLPNLT